MTNYSQLVLLTVMMHQVVKSDAGDANFETVLTDAPVDLDAQKLGYLLRRFQTSLSNRAVPVVQGGNDAHPTRSTFLNYWAGQDDLVSASKSMATHLADLQPGSAAEGLLVVAEVRVGNEHGLLLAKVEHQEAMRLEPTQDDAGHSVFTVELLRDLVFGDKTRIFKVATFLKAWSATGQITGEAVDEQSYGSHIAAYFLETFLGMRPREEPAVLTESALEGFTKAINSSTMSGEQKMNAQNALLSELQSNDHQVDPQAFIRRHIPNGHGAEVAQLARDAGAPTVVFAKNLDRVASRMRRVRVDLDRDITLVAPPEEIGEDGSIKVEDGAEGQTLRIAHANIRSIRPGAR